MAGHSKISGKSRVVAEPVTRRQALAVGLGGLVAAGGLIAFGPRAFGFSIVEADAPIATAFHAACGAVQYHEQLASEVRSLLAVRGEQPPAQISCPVCGCRVAMLQPAAEK